MDSTAFSLCMDNKIPIIVFNLGKKTISNELYSVKKIGTLITDSR